MAIKIKDFIKADCRTRFLGGGPGARKWYVLDNMGGRKLLVVREGCMVEEICWHDGGIHGQMGDYIHELNHPNAAVLTVSQAREDLSDWYYDKGEIRDINTGASVIWE